MNLFILLKLFTQSTDSICGGNDMAKPLATEQEVTQELNHWDQKFAAGEMGPNTYIRMATLAISKGFFESEEELYAFENQLEMEQGK